MELAEAKAAAKRVKPSTAEEKCVHARELVSLIILHS